MATGIITNTLLDPNGDPIVGVQVDANLTRSPGIRIIEGTTIVAPETTTTDENGDWSLTLELSSNIDDNVQWVIHERIPYAQGGARFTMVNVTLGTNTLPDATISTYTPSDPASYYSAAQIDVIIAGLVTAAIEGEVQAIIDAAVLDAVAPYDARLDTLEGQGLDGRLSTLEGHNLDPRLDTLEGHNLDSRLDVLEATVPNKLDANDPSVTNDRDPTPHGASHEVGGDDALVIGVSQLDATGTADDTTYLRGDGTWDTPEGGGGGGGITSATVTGIEAITQAEYDLLSPPDPATLYFITDGA